MTRLQFEWDESKNASNQRKYGVSFEEAKTIFTDDFARLMPDPDHLHGEERFIMLGMSVRLRLPVACHCEREPDVIRIISARRADKHERKQYEDFIHA